MSPGLPAVFLDRDDTLIACRAVAPDGDLGDPGLVELLPGVRGACLSLRRAGFTLVVVSNQGGVARGRFGVDAVHAVNERLNELLGGLVEAFRFCPFHPRGVAPGFDVEHFWRKPRPGMILDAAEVLGLDLSRSWMVGDAVRDCQAGRAAGCRTILIGDEWPAESDGGDAVDALAPDLRSAAEAIIAMAREEEGVA